MTQHRADHDHPPEGEAGHAHGATPHDHHDRDGGRRAHGHSHGVLDPSITSTERGLWAVKWSFVALLLTALFQLAIVALSGSVALLADTIHNFADAATAIPLWIAFACARRAPSRRFPYGYGRVEDLAGLVIVLTILASAGGAAYQAVGRLLDPQPVGYLPAVAAAGVVGFAGNEAVAVFRIRVGRAIGSAALVADGYHARADGLTSLAVLGGVAGVWWGFPLADPAVGLLITAVILVLVWQAARLIVTRMLDGVEPSIVETIEDAARHVPAVDGVTDVRARWVGHRVHAEISVTVAAELSVAAGHDVAREVHHQVLHHLPHLGQLTVHVDPAGAGGEQHHGIAAHAHDGLGRHPHA